MGFFSSLSSPSPNALRHTYAIDHDYRKWLAKVGTRTLYIEPESPWENSYCESFNGKLRDEF